MAEFRAPSPSPARVHEHARRLLGFQPCWERRAYRGGLLSIEHFRICSYCGSIRPDDVIDLLIAGEADLEESSRPGKYWLISPNPIAGDLVHMGSCPGKIFDGRIEFLPPARRMAAPSRSDLHFIPDRGERLAGHYERPALEQAPPMIRWPLYSEHISDRQWPEIWAAKGEHHAEV